MPIKVLYIISDSSFGGASRHLFDLLTNLDKKKFRPILLSRPSPILARLKNKLKTYTVEMKGRLDLGAIKNTKKIIEQEKPALIHLHSTRAGILGTLAAKNLGIPIIYTEHLFTREYQPANKLVHFLQLRTFSHISPHINKVVAVSKAVKRYLVEKKIFPAEKIEVIYNGIPIEQSAAHCRPSTTSLIGSVGALNKDKGYEYLIKAMPEISKKAKTRLEILGEGQLKDKLENLAKKLKITKNVKFWGFKKNPQKFMLHWDIYIQPSLDESFCLALAEAMSVGLPVIASNVGGMPELVGSAGLLVPPRDVQSLSSAIIKLVNDDGLRRKLGKMAEDRIKRYFSADKMVSKIEGLYEKIVKTRPGLK